MELKTKYNQGFIKKIILIIIALILIKYYFHFDILEWAKSPEGQSFIAPAIEIIKKFYIWADGIVRNLVT